MKLHVMLVALLSSAVVLLPLAGAGVTAAPTLGGCPVFPSDHVWNTPIDTLPLDPNSASYINTIGAGATLKADFGAGLWDGGPIGIPYVTVPGSQTKYPATFLYDDESDVGPYAVPLNAPIEGGSQSNGDRHTISVDTTNCVLYELYRAFPQTSSWRGDSGAIYDLKGYNLRPAGWTSADAAGLPIFPGLVRYDEVAAGEITHAIRFTVPQTRNTYVWPARHKASSLTGTQYPPMGQRFRLRADYDISGFSAANQVILRALKKYGMILADNGSAIYMSGVPDSRWNNDDLQNLKKVLGSKFEAVDESSLMIDPNSGRARQSTGSAATPTPSQTPAGTATATRTPNATTTAVATATKTMTATAISTATATATRTATATATQTATATATQTATATATQTATRTPVGAVTVTVSPSSTSLRVNRVRQFSATVKNTSNTAVVWKVNGIVGGNSTIGTISPSGVYWAPSRVPSPSKVTITATSVQSPSVSGNATVTIRRF